MANGDKDGCHRDVRDFVYRLARAAGLNPEREESGLLPDDPRRRPGDLYFALWPGGTRVAFDFAITSPVQLAEIGNAARSQLSAAIQYEATKLSDRDTASQCAALGLQLIPIVAESFSGWGPRAQDALATIARASATRSGTAVGTATTRMYEGLSTIIMRANARALLARVQCDARNAI